MYKNGSEVLSFITFDIDTSCMYISECTRSGFDLAFLSLSLFLSLFGTTVDIGFPSLHRIKIQDGIILAGRKCFWDTP